MELLALLIVLIAINVALWLGLGTDSREPDNNWHPATAHEPAALSSPR